MANDRSNDTKQDDKTVAMPGRRAAMKKVGKLAYTAPVLTVISLNSEAQIMPPSPPDGVQQQLIQQGLLPPKQ